jgi:DNA-binding CsgD family transcriptional regulator
LFTDGELERASLRLLHNELLEDDFNKFTSLASSTQSVGTLSGATHNNLSRSARFRNILSDLAFGDEMRAALTVDSSAWGVLCLHRERSGMNFSAAEIALLRQVAPDLARGLRKAMLIDVFRSSIPRDNPGLVILDDRFCLISSTPAAERWLAEMKNGPRTVELPFPVYAVAAGLKAREHESTPSAGTQALVRIESGQWLRLHASHISDPAKPGQVAVILELARPPELDPVIVQAFDLSRREAEITQLVARGLSTAEISARLFISTNTVQDHLKSIFTKVGVNSRRTLIAQIYYSHLER